MSKYTSEQYNKVFWKLPVEIRDIITSYSTTEHINIVGKKHNLQIDKIGELVDLTFDIMMGMVATKDFITELQDTLQIGALEASVLARDIDENIFKPVKETMTHLYAGRAPYKPSSSLVEYYEEDDEHPSLNKDTLLKEIEDPEPSQVKKEATVIASKGVSVQAGEEIHASIPNNLTPSHTHTLVEYHEELKNEEKNKSFQMSDVSSGNVKQNTVPEKPPIVLGVDGLEKSSRLQNGPIVQDIKNIPIPKQSAGKDISMQGSTEVPNNLTSSQPNQLRGDSILNQLASIKLSQAFVMPKGPEGIKELRKMESENLVGKSVSVKAGEEIHASIPNNLTPSHTNTLDVTSPHTDTLPKTPSPKIDPYREAI